MNKVVIYLLMFFVQKLAIKSMGKKPLAQFMMRFLILCWALISCSYTYVVHHHTHPYKILGLKYNISESCFDGLKCEDDEHIFGFVMDFIENRGSCNEDFELSGHMLQNEVLDELDEDMCLDVSLFFNHFCIGK